MMAKYPFLSAHLLAQGFQVYTREMVCGSIGCRHEANRFVDVAAQKQGFYYAFEYKSNGDHILRALPQVENYSQSFDYVIIVAELPRTEISLDLRRGVRIKEFLRLGAGIWTVKFDKMEKGDPPFTWIESINPQFQVLIEPSLQSPNPKNKEWIRLKFEHYLKRMPLLKHQLSENQRELTDNWKDSDRS